MTGVDRRSRWAATALAVIAGLGLASVHWVGLIAGAALVALPQRSLGRGVLVGVVFGVLTLAVMAFGLVLAGPAATATASAMPAPLGVAVAVAVVGGAVGGLVRGVVG
ncbi:hypothetical protein [Halobaculum limi]|uniref:hypothetical protein n=1 Tax=Halobaculum limi TaxID=3031916 RepID=UPI002405EEDF|nr:hypothetical protein [Halobaculum sp. YSMS11]